MTKISASLCVFLLLFGMTPVFAQETGAATEPAAATTDALPPDVNPDDPGSIFTYIAKAFTARTWGPFAAGLLMLLVWIGRLVIPRLPTKYIPWVAASAGVLASVAASLAMGWEWWRAILNGLTVGAAAVGFWELFGKLFSDLIKKPTDGDGEKKPE
jgi:hypothetical protein